MRLAFFGGSFDPPHLGHLAVAQAAAKDFSLDRVLFAPTGRQPLKRHGAVASFADRLAMVGLLCEQDERMVPSTIDAPHSDGSPNYTIEALTRLKEQCEGTTLFTIIGADSLLDLPKWRQSERLFELATWISVSRLQPTFPDTLPEMLKMEEERGRLHLIRDVNIPTSSTALRERLHKSSRDTGEEIPESVLRYIKEHNLYLGTFGNAAGL